MSTGPSVSALGRSLARVSTRGHRKREIVTPEGVVIGVELADRGERAAAVLIDLMLIGAAFVVVLILAYLVFKAIPDSRAVLGGLLSFVMLAMFTLKTFYFIYFELRWHGRTPGKRALGLQVVDRQGGALRAEAIFARNLFREIEIFIPALALLTLEARDAAGWEALSEVVWLAIFVLMPMFNRDVLRAGDMVAGTWVVTVPKARLLPDLVAASANGESDERGEGGPKSQFSREQLDAYGEYELQTLETVLRRQGANADKTRSEVSKRIQRKIDWRPSSDWSPDDGEFLEAFYSTLRSHLETRMLFGVRRRDKHDRG